MAIASDGKVHLIRCDICGLQDGGPERTPRLFIQRMKQLGWEFFLADDGWDSVCPECRRRRDRERQLPEIVLGR